MVNERKLIPTIAYARVSSREQAEGYSVESQLHDLRQELPPLGYEVVLEVVDVGYERETLFRPGLAEIREAVAHHEYTAVWAKRRDRYGAGPYPQMFADELATLGCSLRALDGSGDGERTEFFDGIKDLMSREELRELARRSIAGRRQKARSGKLVSNGRPNFGFRYTSDGNSYEVYEPEMIVVRRIFEMIGVEGLTLTAACKRLYEEGVPAQNGGRWHHSTLRSRIVDDVYYPHTKEELEPLLSPSVYAGLDPNQRYGIWWYGRWRKTEKRVSVEKKVQTRKPKPRSEWIAVPVPDAGVPREVADAARRRVSERGVKHSRADRRTWQLTGGVLRCGECGRTAITNTSYPKAREGTPVYSYRCKGRRFPGEDRCSFSRTPGAPKLEETVWQEVSSLLCDPERLRRGAEEVRKQEIGSAAADPAGSLSRRRAAEKRRSGYLDLAASGRMSYGELDDKLAVVEAEISAAEAEHRRALEATSRAEELTCRLETFAGMVEGLTTEDLAALTPEERIRVYSMLELEAYIYQDGRLRIVGVPPLEITTWTIASPS
jgi:site-specific DNA recombinase